MATDGPISREEALQRVEPGQIVQLLLPRFDGKAKEAAENAGRLLTRGRRAPCSGSAPQDPG